jgi:nucleoside-diphosphate-sugar epimerase
MRVVVVGCNGFIGKAVINELNSLGIENIGIAKEEFNLLEDTTSLKLKGVLRENDQIVFTSAIAPSKSAEDVRKSIKISEVFCNSLSELNIKQVVLISSDSVYGDKGGLFNELSSCDPNSFHGLAQLSREVILQNSNIKNLAILRVCPVYGEGDTHNGYGPNRFINQIRNSEEIEIFGEGLNFRDHIYIDDVVNLIIRSLKSNFVGTLNIVSGKSYSFSDVADKCRTIFSPLSKIRNSGIEGEIIIKGFDISKINETFPDFKAMNLADGLALWKNRSMYFSN